MATDRVLRNFNKGGRRASRRSNKVPTVRPGHEPSIHTLNRIVDFSAHSMDYFPIVDLHLLLHLYEEGIEVGRYEENIDFSKAGKYAGLLQRRLVPADGPNVENLRVLQTVEELSVVARSYHKRKASGEIKKRLIAGCDHRMIYEKRFLINADPNKWKEDPFLKRIFRQDVDGIGVLSDVPVIGQMFKPEPSAHMVLQEGFNRQTQRTAEAQERLENILEDSKDINFSAQMALERVQGLGSQVDYDLELFYQLQAEAKFKTQKNARAAVGSITLKALEFYHCVTQFPRTSVDLWRAIFLKKTLADVEYALENYTRLDGKGVKREFANLFLEPRIEAQMKGVLEEESKKAQGKKLIQQILVNEWITFESVYRSLANSIEANLSQKYMGAVVDKKRAGRVSSVRREIDAFMARYNKAGNAKHSDFLMGTLSDSGQFRRRADFLETYKGVEDVTSTFKFVERYSALLGDHLGPRTVTNWMAVESLVGLDNFKQFPEERKREVAEVVADDAYNAAVMIEFLNQYESIQSLIKADIRKKVARRINPPQVVLDTRDFTEMESYLDRVVEAADGIEKVLFGRQLAPYEGKNPQNIGLISLVEEDTTFVRSNFSTLKEVRRGFISYSNREGYAELVDKLASADSSKVRRDIIAGYVGGDDTKFQRARRVIMFMEDEPAPYEEPPKLRLATENEKNDGRVYINHLVVVGGFKRCDYEAVLGEEFKIRKLTVLGANPLRRLEGMTGEQTYLLISGNLSHSAEAVIRSNVAKEKIAKTHHGGQERLLAALRELYT